MKKILLAASFILLTSIVAVAQGRPRYFDNFDTSQGVKVYTTQTSAPSTVRDSRGAVNHYLPSPPTGNSNRNRVIRESVTQPLVRKTAQTTMRVGDGYSHATLRTAETPRLMMETSGHLKGQSTGDQFIDNLIVDSSRRYRIDPLLIYQQMGQESSFKLRALSNKGASGLMQLMPATARRLGVTNIYDPKQNIEGGVKYMRILLDMFGQDVNLALAGYNAGEGAVMKYGYTIPPYNETQDYVRRISARYRSISNVSTYTRTYR